MARYFFALDIPNDSKQALSAIQQRITPLLPKPTTLENLHLTLAFLGDITAEQKSALINYAALLPQNVSKNTRYNLIADHTGVFEQAKVMYVGLAEQPAWLNSLAAMLEAKAKELGISMVERPYHAHITISRKVKSMPVPMSFKESIPINSFSLYQSISTPGGVKYLPEVTFSLTK